VSFADHHLPIDSDAVLFEGPPVALCPATDPSSTGRSFPLGATVLGDGVGANRRSSILANFASAASSHGSLGLVQVYWSFFRNRGRRDNG
jgi:hypothetical protein